MTRASRTTSGRGTVFYVAPEALTYDVEKGHPLHEIDRKRVTEIDEELVLSFMALGVLDPVQIAVEENEKGEKRYVVADGRRRVFNAVEANKRLKKINEPQIAVPALVPKGADEKKLSEIMVALNELKKPHSVMVKVEKAARLYARLNDTVQVARAFGVEPQTINIWLKLSSLCTRGKKLVDDGTLAPSAAAKFSHLSSAEQETAIDEFLKTAEAEGVKPTAALAAATVRGKRRGVDVSQAGAGPSKRVLKALLEREELRKNLDPIVVKTIKWLMGEGDIKQIGGLSAAVNTILEERKAAAKAKAARKAERAKRKAARAEAAAKAEGTATESSAALN
jgi:hypothetical protein